MPPHSVRETIFVSIPAQASVLPDHSLCNGLFTFPQLSSVTLLGSGRRGPRPYPEPCPVVFPPTPSLSPDCPPRVHSVCLGTWSPTQVLTRDVPSLLPALCLLKISALNPHVKCLPCEVFLGPALEVTPWSLTLPLLVGEIALPRRSWQGLDTMQVLGPGPRVGDRLGDAECAAGPQDSDCHAGTLL